MIPFIFGLFKKRQPEAAPVVETVVTTVPETITPEAPEPEATVEVVPEEQPVVEQPVVELEKYHIGFYRHGDGSPGRVKGKWMTSAQDVRDEANSTLYARKLGYVLDDIASIEKHKVEKMAEEHNCTIGEILSYV
jgi:hypothetical protein